MAAASCAGESAELVMPFEPVDLFEPVTFDKPRPVAGPAKATYQPIRARRLVMCAVWWRLCQSYIANTWARLCRPLSGCT